MGFFLNPYQGRVTRGWWIEFIMSTKNRRYELDYSDYRVFRRIFIIRGRGGGGNGGGGGGGGGQGELVNLASFHKSVP